MNAKRQRELYARTVGTSALERQIVANARLAGCKCVDDRVLANAVKGSHAGHDYGCPLRHRGDHA